MRDPHVQKLYYEIGSGEGISYENPEPLAFSNHLGAFELREGKLTVVPTEHFGDEEDARQAIKPFLQAWEIEADLNLNIGTIRFKFGRAELVDRDPSPTRSHVINAKAGEMVMIGERVSFHLTRSKYPQPPLAFRTTLEVDIAYRRWIAYREGKEPLQSVAYFILTMLESSAGGRGRAAQVFRIARPVLDTIGRLSSTRGDASTARKIKPGRSLKELSGSEKQWLEQAVRRVIHRLGEHASGADLPLITLADLPKL